MALVVGCLGCEWGCTKNVRSKSERNAKGHCFIYIVHSTEFLPLSHEIYWKFHSIALTFCVLKFYKINQIDCV